MKASYGVEQPLYAVMQLAQTTMRSELGKITLDKTFEERDTLNANIVRVRPDLLTLRYMHQNQWQGTISKPGFV